MSKTKSLLAPSKSTPATAFPILVNGNSILFSHLSKILGVRQDRIMSLLFSKYIRNLIPISNHLHHQHFAQDPSLSPGLLQHLPNWCPAFAFAAPSPYSIFHEAARGIHILSLFCSMPHNDFLPI